MFKNTLRFLVSPCSISLGWLPWVLCVGGFVVTMLLVYPGKPNGTDVMNYTQAVSGQYTDWHPPIFAAAWGVIRNTLLSLGVENATGQCVLFSLNTVLVWGGFSLILHAGKSFWSNTHLKPLWMVIPVILALFVITLEVYTLCRIHFKDFLHLGCLLVGTGCLLNFPRRFFLKIILGIVVLFLFLFAAALRHNYLFALLPMLFYLVWQFVENKQQPFFNTFKIVAVGLMIWGTFIFINRYITDNVLHTYHLYPIQETFYGDIFRMNYYDHHNYKNPPNVFECRFDEIDKETFKIFYQPSTLFQRFAFRPVIIASKNTERDISLIEEFVCPVSDDEIAKGITPNVTVDNSILMNYPSPEPLLMISEKRIREKYPNDYLILRNAWIERIKKNPREFVVIKFKIWMKYLLSDSPRTIFLVTGGLANCLALFTCSALLCLFTVSPKRLTPELFPTLMFAWSAVFLVLPFLLFLPDNNTRYLYWFVIASFIAIGHFLAHSPLFAEITQTMQRYWERKIDDEH